ncbi:K02A2.6-like [Cordylochernes scorpioides]|uniref:Mitochondrial proton/calcium exchanger protein n=1 Tax=Cordylochernes scorpioides TaxID=51811 RepID=A0ABY6KS40_9ARAC|nr:K02A2.6-like [Cordylochernes scorpioides]
MSSRFIFHFRHFHRYVTVRPQRRGLVFLAHPRYTWQPCPYWMQAVRPLSCHPALYNKVEQTVQELKEKQVAVAAPPKRTIWKKVKDELIHYYHGFRLLFIDIRVSTRLGYKVLKGEDLSRRERRQLVRTVSDVFRLLPFSVFIIVPFMELLLPVFLKFFPGMLPSTFEKSSAAEAKFKKELKVKLEMAKFLQTTLGEMALTTQGEKHSHSAKEFAQFIEKVRASGEQTSNKDIIKFSKLFEDEITLDSLNRPQLIALCRLLELQAFGADQFLQFQIRTKLRHLKADDQVRQTSNTSNEELNAFVIKTGSTTQWQADLAPKEMAASDMRNRRHVQLLLTWSTNAAHPVNPGLGALTGTLNVHERKYSQVEREGLAIVFAVNKLKNYLFGRKFTIYTDHKPLITIFGDKTNLPPLIANRLHRWALTLSNYSFEIKYKKGKDNIIPDFLSRFPECQEDNLEYNDGSGEILLLNTSIIDHVLVAHEIQLDRTLIKLYKIIETGELPSSPNDDLIPYLKRIDDFTILQECIFLENRMVIPKSLHERVLQILHESHAGTNKMKMMARSSIWWPGMDSSIEIITKNCRTCLSNESLPPQRTESWPKYAGPWRRVHMDYFNFKNKLFLLAVDSFSSWVEVSEVPSTSAYFCINFMRNCIARYGFPQVVVSDNGPPFFSSDFGDFLSKNGISHVTSPPYHPQSNGQAEVSVREVKKLLKKQLYENEQVELNLALSRALFFIRTDVNIRKGTSPAELFLGRKIRSRLSVLSKEEVKASKFNSQYVNSKFKVDETVKFRWITNGHPSWYTGKIIKILGRNVYLIKQGDSIKKVHQNYIRKMLPGKSHPTIMNEAERVPTPISEEKSITTPSVVWQMIKREGIDSLSVPELQAACRARGMRAMGVPKERLQMQLNQWLELSLNEHVPQSLLLLSRTLYLPENLPASKQLEATISKLSDKALTEAKFKLGEIEGKVDNKTKIELIREEEAAIRQEEAEEEAQKAKDKELFEEEKELPKAPEWVPDKEFAPQPSAAAKDPELLLDEKKPAAAAEELSKEDIENLENAIKDVAEKKLLIEKEELEDLKEEMAEYKEDIEELKEVVQDSKDKPKIKETRAARRLSSKVSRLINQMDELIDNLGKEKETLMEQMSKEDEPTLKEKDDLISITDLIGAIKKIQKMPNDTKLEKIADVLDRMDVDNDGAVEVEHVLKVIELMGKENVRVTSKQMGEILEMIQKEEFLKKTQEEEKKF